MNTETLVIVSAILSVSLTAAFVAVIFFYSEYRRRENKLKFYERFFEEVHIFMCDYTLLPIEAYGKQTNSILCKYGTEVCLLDGKPTNPRAYTYRILRKDGSRKLVNRYELGVIAFNYERPSPPPSPPRPKNRLVKEDSRNV